MNSATEGLLVYKKDYDSRYSYSMWTTGEAYVVCVGSQKFISGYTHQDNISIMSEKFLNETMKVESYESWKIIPFCEISLFCQRDLVEKMKSLFPWSQSAWECREEFNEYWNPQTFEGKVEKALRDRYFFYRELFVKNEWQQAIEESEVFEDTADYKEEIVVLKNGNYYFLRSGFNYKENYWATIKKITPEEGEKLLKKAKELENQKAIARKEHARKCGVMARKYGIPFEISLRCFKGNEEDIKNFVETLKKAFDKDYDSHELSCGRYRRKAEIERLGIEIGNIDSNYIADYILKCLEAGKIVK